MPQLPDVPWHTEVLKTNDDYRHKHRCIHNEENYCNFLKEKCRGSAHCNYYKEIQRKSQLVRSKGYILVFRKTKTSESMYWYEQNKEDAYADAKLLRNKGYIVERLYEGPNNCRIYVKD